MKVGVPDGTGKENDGVPEPTGGGGKEKDCGTGAAKAAVMATNGARRESFMMRRDITELESAFERAELLKTEDEPRASALYSSDKSSEAIQGQGCPEPSAKTAIRDTAITLSKSSR